LKGNLGLILHRFSLQDFFDVRQNRFECRLPMISTIGLPMILFGAPSKHCGISAADKAVAQIAAAAREEKRCLVDDDFEFLFLPP
jgi:hypothetical protein